MKRVLISMIVVALLGGITLADRMILKSGRTLEGTITVKGTMLVITTDRGEVKVPLSDVKKIDTDPASPAEQYASRNAAISRNDKPGHMALAKWCADNGLTTEERYHLLNALRITPEDTSLRRRLGFRFRNGRWITETQEKLAQGLIRYKGKWMTPEKKARIEKIEKDEAARRARETAAEKEKREREKRRRQKMIQVYSMMQGEQRIVASRRTAKGADFNNYLPPWYRALYAAFQKHYPQFFTKRQQR